MQKVLLWSILSLLLSGCTVYVPRNGVPPGHGGLPPGHGGVPPGQAKKMGPPPVRIVGIPRFVLVPGSRVMVLANVDADIFFVNGFYYYYHHSSWWVAQHVEGPWRSVSSHRLPPGLKGRSARRLKAEALNTKRHARHSDHEARGRGHDKNMGPPPLRMAGLPSFARVPGTNIMVVVNIDAAVFYVNGFYYYSHRSLWWVAKHVDGPWRVISSRSLPAGLRGKSPAKLKAEASGRKRRGRRS